MKKGLILASAIACLATGASAASLVINEVYPGGGSGAAGTTYTRDFVEIYNTTAAPISLAGYSLQYAAAAGDFTGFIVQFGAGSIIAANDYISIYTGSAGTAGASLTAGTGPGFVTYVAPTSSASLSATGGSVRLFDGTTTVDVIGYGSATQGTAPGTSPKFEGAVAAALPGGNATSYNRTGFADTNSNSADFTSGTPSPNGGTSSVVVAVPEPSSVIALLGGLGVLLGVRRYRPEAA